MAIPDDSDRGRESGLFLNSEFDFNGIHFIVYKLPKEIWKCKDPQKQTIFQVLSRFTIQGFVVIFKHKNSLLRKCSKYLILAQKDLYLGSSWTEAHAKHSCQRTRTGLTDVNINHKSSYTRPFFTRAVGRERASGGLSWPRMNPESRIWTHAAHRTIGKLEAPAVHIWWPVVQTPHGWDVKASLFKVTLPQLG